MSGAARFLTKADVDTPYPWPNECSVYLIGEADARSRAAFVKVGISNNTPSRLRTIRTSCPISVEIIMEWWLPTRDQAVSVERWFHIKHVKHRTSGEWFFMRAGEVIAEIESVISLALEAGE